VCLLLAVVLAHGCNIGLHTMAQITQGVTYSGSHTDVFSDFWQA
jgi:hypothetical protein